MIKKQKKVSLESVGERFDGVDKRMDGLDKKIDRLEKKIDKIDESNRKNGVLLEKLDAKFDLSLEGYSSLKERTDKLENRVGALEMNS